mmetsp:Transcript_2186/g.4349  ORF Transcript_2186/g.4349 Transcript_2186/m.4349 type:complete len:225 (+) Transcript_2186:185-859(+)
MGDGRPMKVLRSCWNSARKVGSTFFALYAASTAFMGSTRGGGTKAPPYLSPKSPSALGRGVESAVGGENERLQAWAYRKQPCKEEEGVEEDLFLHRHLRQRLPHHLEDGGGGREEGLEELGLMALLRERRRASHRAHQLASQCLRLPCVGSLYHKHPQPPFPSPQLMMLSALKQHDVAFRCSHHRRCSTLCGNLKPSDSKHHVYLPLHLRRRLKKESLGSSLQI